MRAAAAAPTAGACRPRCAHALTSTASQLLPAAAGGDGGSATGSGDVSGGDGGEQQGAECSDLVAGFAWLAAHLLLPC